MKHVIAIASGLALAGCGRVDDGSERADTSVSVQDSASPDSYEPDLAIPQPDAARPDYGLVVDGDGPCAPDAPATFAVASCCNGVPCAGQCIREEDGGLSCACYRIKGGCTGSQVCCRGDLACTTWSHCDRGK